MSVTSTLLRFAGAAALSMAAVCAAGAWPTWKVAGADGLAGMGVAAGISFLGAVLGFLPTAAAPARYESRIHAAMLGVGIRMLVTATVVFGVVWTGAAPARGAFLAWVGIGYATMLVLETAHVLRVVRPPAPGGKPASA